MDTREAINKRRSIRKYRSSPVAEEQLREILQAGIAAPSAGNLQSRHFYVVRDEELKRKLAAAALEQEFLAAAPVAIVICADHRIKSEYGDRGIELYGLLDCAAAIENMMLMAVSLGLGSCWVGALDERKIAAIIGAPSHFRPVSIMALGHPDESPEPPAAVALEHLCDFR